jgi:hypothetical protein
MKLPAHRAALPGHAVASRMRAKEISFLNVPFAVHVENPGNSSELYA